MSRPLLTAVDVGRRVVLMLLTLLLTSFLTFVFLHMAPGDPVEILLGGKVNDPAIVERINEQYGFNDPLLVQYWHWLVGAVQGDLGTSYLFREDVTSLIASRLPTTTLLVAMGGTAAILLGFLIGLVAARSRSAVDNSTSALLVVGLATPTYVVAIVLITVFSLYLNWFPVFGSGTGLADRVHHLALPAVTLALASCVALARVTRAAIREEQGRDHVTTAVARGLDTKTVVRRHIVRNALLPIVTIAGIVLASMIAGTVIVEKAYGLDGIGSLLVVAITRKDYSVVQGVTVLVVGAFLIVNLMVDLLYGVIDPRTRAGASG